MVEEGISSRIIAIMERFNLTSAKLSRRIGLDNMSTMSRIVNRHVNPSFEILYRLLESFPEISGTWLITGRGEMTAKDVALASEKNTECKECEQKQKLLEEKERTIKVLMKVSGMGE